MATDPSNGLELRAGHEIHEPRPFPFNGGGTTYLIPSRPVATKDERERALIDALRDYEDAKTYDETSKAELSIVSAAVGVTYEKPPEIEALTLSQFSAIYGYIVTGAVKGEG